MTLTLFDTIQRIVQEELGRVRTAEIGIVQDQQTGDGEYSCTVQLRDSGIVLKRVPVATPLTGSAAIPAVGDMVLVQFLGGDVNAPVVTGSLYNDEDRPPENKAGQSVLHLPLGVGKGDAVHIELTGGDERTILLTLGDGLELVLKDDDPVITVKVAGGAATVEIGRDGTIKLEGQSDVKVHGVNVTIEADAELKLKGATVKIN